jgi:short subunit dehydrogenase-like uncharacterized protein
MCYEGDAYLFTAIALAEAARILLWQQDNSSTWAYGFGGGVLTPATLGDQYVSQLRVAGLTIDARNEPADKGVYPFGKK